MNDPVYENGITSESIVTTLSDISEALKGKLSYISVPIPIDSIAPVSHILFKDSSADVIKPLSVRTRTSESRRAHNYSLRHGVPMQHAEDRTSTNKSVQKVDDADSILQDYNINEVEHFMKIRDNVMSKNEDVESSKGSRRRRVPA